MTVSTVLSYGELAKCIPPVQSSAWQSGNSSNLSTFVNQTFNNTGDATSQPVNATLHPSLTKYGLDYVVLFALLWCVLTLFIFVAKCTNNRHKHILTVLQLPQHGTPIFQSFSREYREVLQQRNVQQHQRYLAQADYRSKVEAAALPILNLRFAHAVVYLCGCLAVSVLMIMSLFDEFGHFETLLATCGGELGNIPRFLLVWLASLFLFRIIASFEVLKQAPQSLVVDIVYTQKKTLAAELLYHALMLLCLRVLIEAGQSTTTALVIAKPFALEPIAVLLHARGCVGTRYGLARKEQGTCTRVLVSVTKTMYILFVLFISLGQSARLIYWNRHAPDTPLWIMAACTALTTNAANVVLQEISFCCSRCLPKLDVRPWDPYMPKHPLTVFHLGHHTSLDISSFHVFSSLGSFSDHRPRQLQELGDEFRTDYQTNSVHSAHYSHNNNSNSSAFPSLPRTNQHHGKEIHASYGNRQDSMFLETPVEQRVQTIEEKEAELQNTYARQRAYLENHKREEWLRGNRQQTRTNSLEMTHVSPASRSRQKGTRHNNKKRSIPSLNEGAEQQLEEEFQEFSDGSHETKEAEAEMLLRASIQTKQDLGDQRGRDTPTK